MPMHIHSSINTDSSSIATAGPIASSLSLATQNDILAILQREQDHAMLLLSLSPLLSSLFISYADRAVTLQSASVTPSPESMEWKTLQSNIAALREENEKLKSENRELAVKLATAEASQEAFRSQVSSLKEVNATQQGDIKSLRVELVEAKDTYDRLSMNSDAERAAHQIRISDLEAQWAELREAVVEQQIKISKLERQASSGSSNLPKAAATTEPIDIRELNNREGLNREAVAARSAKAKEHVDREAREQAEREARERTEEMVRVEAEKQAKEKAEQKAREKAERQARERAERMKGRLERIEKEEKEKAEREAKEKADRGVKKREEEEKKKVPTSKLPPAWGSNVGKNDRSRKTSGLSQKEQKNEWGSSWDLGSIEKNDEPSGPPPTITSSIPGSILGGAGNFDIFATEKKDSPGCAEEVELRTPLTKKGKKGIDSLSNLSKVATPTEAADLGKLDILEDPGLNNASARVSISLENERFLDAEQEPSPTKPTRLVLAPEVPPEALSSTASESLKASKDVKDDVPTTPKHWPAPPLTTTHQPQIPTPAPAPAKTEPEKPLSLWERKKLNAATPPAPASSLFGGGGTMNSLSVWGDVSGGGNAESIAMPTLVGDRQSIFTDTARDRKRENQRENVTGGFLGSNPARRRNDSAQSGMTAKPVPKPAPAPAPVQQKSSGWGSWGSSLLANIASATADPDRLPSPELPPVKPKIEDPPRFTPSQPPKSQPAGFGPLSKPGWGTGGGTGDNNVWGAGKPSPAPITQKTSTGPSWGAKPTGSMFGSGVGKNLTVDTATKPLERSLSTTGPENTPESAVEVKHVLALGGFNTKVSSRVEEKAPKAQTEETGEPVRTEEVTTPAEEDEFDRANQGKKGHVTSVAQTSFAPNTPDPENGDYGPGGGDTGRRNKKKGRR